jgi:hypothetical protein
MPIINVGQAEREELRTMFRDLSDMEVEHRWLDAYAESAGYCAGYFIERTRAIRILSGKLWSEGKRPYAETTKELVLHIPPGLVRKNRLLTCREVGAEMAMRFSQVFDDLPPLFQIFAKVLTMATSCGFYELPRNVMWEVLNDLIAQGVDHGVLDTVVSELREMCLVRLDDKLRLSFQSPAFADIAFDVSTPVQIKTIGSALIGRLDPLAEDDFR